MQHFPIHKTIVIDAMLQGEHMADLVGHDLAGPVQYLVPVPFLGNYAGFEAFLVPRERKHSDPIGALR